MDSYFFSYNTFYSSIIMYRKREIIISITRSKGLTKKFYVYALAINAMYLHVQYHDINGTTVFEFCFFNRKEKKKKKKKKKEKNMHNL